MLHPVDAKKTLRHMKDADEKGAKEVILRVEEVVTPQDLQIEDSMIPYESHADADINTEQRKLQHEGTMIDGSSEISQNIPVSRESDEHKGNSSKQDEAPETGKVPIPNFQYPAFPQHEVKKVHSELQTFAVDLVETLNLIQKAEETGYLRLEKFLILLKARLEKKLVEARVTSMERLSEDLGFGTFPVLDDNTEKSSSSKVEALEALMTELEVLQVRIVSVPPFSQRKETTCKFDGSKETMRCTSHDKYDSSAFSSNMNLNLSETFASLEKVKAGEMLAVENARSEVDELEEVNAQLKKAANQNSRFASTIESLRIRWNIIEAEMRSVVDRHKSASAIISALKDEIKKVKADAASALAAEVSSKEIISAFTIGLQDMSLEADKAKVSLKEAIEQAHKMNVAALQGKAALKTRECELQVAYREMEAARFCEAISLKEIRYLSQSRGLPVAQTDGTNVETVERGQYDSLCKKLEEVEEQTAGKLVEVMNLLKAEKVVQKELSNQLEAAIMDLEARKAAKQLALKQAEEAEAAKVVVESELRKWRAENGRRKSVDSGTLAAPSPMYSGELVFPITPQKSYSKTDHFAEVFQLSFPPPAEKVYSSEIKQSNPKKMKLFARIVSFFSKRKSQVRA